MHEPMPSSSADTSTRIALVFESALGVAAIAIGWLVGHSPFVGIDLASEQTHAQVLAIGWGLVAAGPLLVALFLCDRFPIGPLRGLQQLTADIISRMFGGATPSRITVRMRSPCWRM